MSDPETVQQVDAQSGAAEMTMMQTVLQHIEETNFKLNLIPALSTGMESVQKQLQSLQSELTQNNENNEIISREVASLNERLSESIRRSNSLELELKRCNLIIYDLQPMNPPRRTLKEEVALYLNGRVRSLQIGRSDIRDVFRFRTGAILLKLNSIDIRDEILRNAQQFRRDGVGVAPDYTTAQREARAQLKPIMSKAISEGKEVRLRGDKLFVDRKLLMYNAQTMRVEEVNRPEPAPSNPQTTKPQAPLRARPPVLAAAQKNCPQAGLGQGPPVTSDRDLVSSESDSSTVIEAAPASNPLSSQLPRTSSAPSSEVIEKRKHGLIISPDDQNRSNARSTRKNSQTYRGDSHREFRYRGAQPTRYQENSYRQEQRPDYYRTSFDVGYEAEPESENQFQNNERYREY